jgi:uncharacterized protein YjbI with pentapeptide repeats
MRQTELSGANLEGANLRRAQLVEANLAGADLAGADLAGADLTGAIPDKDTTWPEGFDPATSPLAVHPRSD